MRSSFSILTLVLVVSTPFWLYLPVILIGVIFFPLYLEAILFGLLVDVIYGNTSFLFGYPFGTAAVILVLFAQPVREHLRFHA